MLADSTLQNHLKGLGNFSKKTNHLKQYYPRGSKDHYIYINGLSEKTILFSSDFKSKSTIPGNYYFNGPGL